MYSNCCFFAAVSVPPFIGGEYLSVRQVLHVLQILHVWQVLHVLPIPKASLCGNCIAWKRIVVSSLD